MSITMSELAKLAGVTRPAVSAVLNNSSGSRVSPEKRARILKLAQETGYVPNLAARQLKGISDRLIGLVTVPSHMGVVATLQSELISALQRRGYEVLTTQQGDVKQILRDFQARNICGMIALGLFPGLEHELFCPYVSCSHHAGAGYDVSCDVEFGCYEATKHLIQVHGRRNPVFVCISDTLGVPNELKYAGMLRAMRGNGIPAHDRNLLQESLVRKLDISPYYETDEADAERIVRELIHRKADAVLCANDFIAGRLIPWIQQAGLTIPADLSVVGYDGYTWTPFAAVPLSTVVQPVRRMAEAAVEMLIGQIEGKDMNSPVAPVKIKPLFLPADSCGCIHERSKIINGVAEIIVQEI